MTAPTVDEEGTAGGVDAPRRRDLGVARRLVPAPLRDPTQRGPLLGWLGVGLMLRLLLMPFAVSADLLAVYWRSHLIAHEGEVFGAYLVNMGAHYVHALSLRVFGFLLPPPEEVWTDPWWWSDSGALAAQVQREFSTAEHVHQTLFALKLPYLLADIGAGLLLLALAGGAGAAVQRARGAGNGGRRRPLRAGATAVAALRAGPLVADPAATRRAWALWMLSPIGLYASYVFGRYEALAVLLVVAALLCAERGRPWWAAVLLGLAVTMRTYPLLLIPVFGLIIFRRPLQQALWAAVAIAPFAAVMASNRLFVGTVGELARLQDFATGSTFFAYTIQVDAAGPIYLFFLFIIGVYGFLAGRSWGWWGEPPARADLWIWLLVIHAGLFALATFAAHYFMWFTPFVAIAIARRARWRGVLPLHLVQVALVFALTDLLGGPGTLTGLFEPVHADLATSLPNLREAFLTDPEQRARLLGLVRTAFAATTFLLVLPALGELAGRRPEDAGPTLPAEVTTA
jgi:hypothetical protein